MNAMFAHKPHSLPLAENVKFTEDCKELRLGEGYWKDIAGAVSYRLDIIDVRQARQCGNHREHSKAGNGYRSRNYAAIRTLFWTCRIHGWKQDYKFVIFHHEQYTVSCEMSGGSIGIKSR
jgi:hypothetical protein